MGTSEVSSAVNEPGRRWLRLPRPYERERAVGRIIGAFRVLVGANASIPKGWHNTNTSYGAIGVRDYYGGCKLSLPECDLYWTSREMDGWGAGPGQPKFEAFVRDEEHSPAALAEAAEPVGVETGEGEG